MIGLVQICDVPELAPPAGPYAHAAILGGTLYVSGLIAWDDAGSLVGPGDAAAQAEFIFARLGKILASVGSGFDDVAKLTLFLVDLSHRAAITPIRRRVFGAHMPASSLVQVTGLIREGTLLEIEAVAGVRAR